MRHREGCDELPLRTRRGVRVVRLDRHVTPQPQPQFGEVYRVNAAVAAAATIATFENNGISLTHADHAKVSVCACDRREWGVSLRCQSSSVSEDGLTSTQRHMWFRHAGIWSGEMRDGRARHAYLGTTEISSLNGSSRNNTGTCGPSNRTSLSIILNKRIHFISQRKRSTFTYDHFNIHQAIATPIRMN